MNLGIRFSSPVFDEIEGKSIKKIFGEECSKIFVTIDSAPYEISIIVSLINKLEKKIENFK